MRNTLVAYNLGRVDWELSDVGYPCAHEFDDAARAIMTTDPGNILDLQGHQHFSVAVPTPDHFIPLLYLAGLAAHDGAAADVLVDGYAMGSLSMTAYGVSGPAMSTDASR